MNTTQRSLILTVLVLVLAATRVNHFAPVPDASWAMFFIGGYYLRGWTRWAFPLLMALSVAVDYYVISGQGISFWDHYCVSAAYWFLVPAYFAMWAGGAWLQRHAKGLSAVRALGLTAATLVAAVIVCHLLSQGSFYWISSSVPQPSLAGWFKNYTDWFLPYLGTASLYVGIAVAVHAIVAAAVKPAAHSGLRRH